MSTYATTTTAADTEKRNTLVRRVVGGGLLAMTLSVVAIAAWPASEADKAYDDGVRYGESVADLYYADSAEEVDAAVSDVHAAASDTREHAGDAVADQVAHQEDALARAVDGFVGYHTSDDDFEAAVYETELDVAVSDLTNQAEDFRAQGSDVQEAFWNGFDDGLNAG
jgi:hypothetical protein